MIRHKYNAKKVALDGFKFDSKLEGRYYEQLKLRKATGEVVQFLRQVPFHLSGGVIYRVDFVEFHADHTVHFVDTKGMDTQGSINKRKQVEDVYVPIKIEIVKKV